MEKQPLKLSASSKLALRILIVFGFVNFIAFAAVAAKLGGDAVAGGRDETHYFLSSHGHATEVSRDVWIYSRIHTISVWISVPLSMVCMAIMIAAKEQVFPPRVRKQ